MWHKWLLLHVVINGQLVNRKPFDKALALRKNEGYFANMPKILKLRPNIFPKKNIQPSLPWIIGKKNFTVLLYSYTLTYVILKFCIIRNFRAYHIECAQVVNLWEAVLLLCTIFCQDGTESREDAREDTTLTRLNWSGHLSANLMKILMIICLHSYRNNLFFSAATCAEARTAFIPAPMSARPGSSWFFESCNHFSFSMLAIDHGLSMASFLKIRPTSFLKIALSSSNINGTMGASVWKRVKYGSNIPVTNKKKCNFAGTKGSKQHSTICS